MEDTGIRFIKETSVPKMEESPQSKGAPRPPFEIDRIDGLSVISLPDPKCIKVQNIDLRDAIENRKSVRKYIDTPLSLEELSYLLWCTQGVRKVTADATYRTVPSAGSRHALETYLLVNKIAGLKPGLYKYMALDHKLIELPSEEDIFQKMRDACPKGHFIESNAVTFIWTCVFYRMVWRHGQRGYRYVHLDAGHVCQNLYLAAQSIQSGACGISVFIDNEVNHLLRVDGEQESAIYLASVGKVLASD